MAFSYALGVTPESLKEKTGFVTAAIDAMNNDLQRIRDEVAGTRNYWQGEAGDLHRKKLEDQAGEIEKLVTRLRTYPKRILVMAGIYQKTEEINETIAAATATDIQAATATDIQMR